jgi:hypothetical protein
MFITANGSASFLHPSNVTHQQHHWTVATRALEAPWYLLVYDVTCHRRRRVSQTSLVAWDETLVEMLASIPAADVTGIGRLDRRHGAGPCWSLQWIDALWQPAPNEARALGPLLLQLGDDPQVRDALLRPVGGMQGRRLLYGARV